jgi:hypothetical protein
MESKQDFPTFCYNVKNIQMLAPTAQLGEENKTIQYIATQPFTTTYGQSYALVNPVQLAGQNGQIVINKPISAVSLSLLFDFFVFAYFCNEILFFLEHNIKYKLQMRCVQSDFSTLDAPESTQEDAQSRGFGLCHSAVTAAEHFASTKSGNIGGPKSRTNSNCCYRLARARPNTSSHQ